MGDIPNTVFEVHSIRSILGILYPERIYSRTRNTFETIPNTLLVFNNILLFVCGTLMI